MKAMVFFLLFLPLTASSQMMPERLTKPDTTLRPSKGSSGRTTVQRPSEKSVADTVLKGTVEPASISTETQLPERQRPEPMSSFEFWLSVIILGFTAVLVIVEVWLIRSRLLSAESALRALLVTIIIGGTLFLITAGYSNDQIAPAVGLFGTIAGYLLGKHVAAKENAG